MTEKTLPLIIYHGGCNDGFTAAWVVWHYFGCEAELLPAYHNDDPPDVTGRQVVIVDFSYDRPDPYEHKRLLQTMMVQAESLQVLDHHASAEGVLSELDFCRFDKHLSGAGLARKYYKSESLGPAPLVDYVQDRDLWTWQMASSKTINAWIRIWEHDLDDWDHINRRLIDDPTSCAYLGQAILEYQRQQVRRLAGRAILARFESHATQWNNVPLVNAATLQSEVGHHLLEMYPDAPFVATWSQEQDEVTYQLRSSDGRKDVSLVAEMFGGGGHPNAAGFSLVDPPAKLRKRDPFDGDVELTVVSVRPAREWAALRVGEVEVQGPPWLVQEILNGNYEKVLAAEFEDEKGNDDE